MVSYYLLLCNRIINYPVAEQRGMDKEIFLSSRQSLGELNPILRSEGLIALSIRSSVAAAEERRRIKNLNPVKS
jgi:hypothetical protein